MVLYRVDTFPALLSYKQDIHHEILPITEKTNFKIMWGVNVMKNNEKDIVSHTTHQVLCYSMSKLP